VAAARHRPNLPGPHLKHVRMKAPTSIILPPPVGPPTARERRSTSASRCRVGAWGDGVASFILLADIGDQHLRALHLDFEGGNQRIFCVNNNVSSFALKFIADRKLHLRSPAFMFKTLHNSIGRSDPRYAETSNCNCDMFAAYDQRQIDNLEQQIPPNTVTVAPSGAIGPGVSRC
jgi:hypothetical protein